MVTAANYGKGTGLKQGGKNEAALKSIRSNGRDATGRKVSIKDRASANELLSKKEEEDKLKTTQKVVSDLNASAERSGSDVRYTITENSQGSIEVGRRQVQRPNSFRSVAQNNGGLTQVPGLQTQTISSSSQEEVSYTRKPDVEPVASSREGTVYRDENGRLYTGFASTNEGTVLTQAQEPRVKLSDRELPGGAAGFATPNFYIDEEKRRDIVRFGESLYETKGDVVSSDAKKAASILQGISLRPPVASSDNGIVLGDKNIYADKLLGGAAREAGRVLEAGNIVVDNAPAVAGSNLMALGYNPRQYVAANVVLPLEGGAALGAGSEVIVRGAGKGFSGAAKILGGGATERIAAGDLGAKAVELGFVGTGAVLTAGEVSARGVDQRPDIVFGTLGAVKGSEPSPLAGETDTSFYGGFKTPNRAQRLNRPTANKPMSKAEMRKQSYNQNYNPNEYFNGVEAGIKTGPAAKYREFVRASGGDGGRNIDVGVRMPAVELGVKGQSVERGITISPNKRTVAPFENYKYTASEKNVPTSPYQGKLNKINSLNPDRLPGVSTNDPYAMIAVRDSRSSISLEQKQQLVNFALGLDKPSKRVPTYAKEPVFNNPVSGGMNVPQYELTPNANAEFSPYQYNRVTGQRSGAQPGRQRVYEDIRQKLLAKNSQRTDFVLVDTPQAQNTVSKDLVLSRQLNTAVAELGGREIAIKSPAVVLSPFKNAGEQPIVVSPSNVRLDNTHNFIQEEITFGKQTPVIVSSLNEKPSEKYVPVPAVKILPDVKNADRSDLDVRSKLSISDFQSFNYDSSVVQKAEQRRVVDNVVRPVSTFSYEDNSPFIADNKLLPDEGRERKPTYFPVPFKTGGPRQPNNKLLQETPPSSSSLRFKLPEMNRPDVAEFEISVGSKGNKYYFNLGQGSTDLIEKAGNLARDTAAARVTVKALNSKAQRIDVESLLGKDFSRNKQGDYIQSTATRISSPGEKRQIPGESKNKRLTKGSTYGKALSANKKGFSLRSIRRGLL